MKIDRKPIQTKFGDLEFNEVFETADFSGIWMKTRSIALENGTTINAVRLDAPDFGWILETSEVHKLDAVLKIE